MQRTEITLVCDNGVLRSIGTGTLSRGVVNELAISFLNRSGKPIDITAVARWEAVVTEDYLRKTPALLASDDSEVIGGDGGGDGEGNGIPPNAVLVRLPGDSAELAAVIDGRKSMQCFVTLYGRNAADDIVNVCVFPLVALNIGVAYDDVAEQAALSGLFYTRAQIDAIKAQIYRDMAALGGGGSGWTPVDASTSTKGIIQIASAAEVLAGSDSTKAVVPSTLKTELDKKVTAVSGKGLSTNDYDNTEKAKVGKIELETLAELTGADVSVAPWTQSKWSASGACSLTASGWAASGHQIAYIVITLAAEATPSIIGTEEVAEDDALSAAGVYECYIKNVDGKKYFRVISFTEAS